MEFISTDQLQKYENIIDQIKCESEKYEILKKDLEKENDNLILSQLADSRVGQKLSHISVLVFNCLIDFLNLYQDEISHDYANILKYENSKFYVVEIYIKNTLMQKVRGLRSMLHISLKTENIIINKTVNLTSKFPIREVIPVDKYIINSTIEPSLLVHTEGKWMLIKLDTVDVDISYHLQIHRGKQNVECKLKNILKVTKSYNNEILYKDLQKPLMLQKNLFCNLTNKLTNESVIFSVLKNCYHSLDMELLLELQSNVDEEFRLKFSNGVNLDVNTGNIVINRPERYFKIEANIEDLCLLKKYFCKEFYEKEEVSTKLVSEILKMLKICENDVQKPQKLCAFFCEVRNSWSKLPI